MIIYTRSNGNINDYNNCKCNNNNNNDLFVILPRVQQIKENLSRTSDKTVNNLDSILQEAVKWKQRSK